jgi:1-acyl-sn-glycerol-3-phosphate acyltransferase
MIKILHLLLLPLRLLAIALLTLICGLIFIPGVLILGKKNAFKYTRVPYLWGRFFCLFTGARLEVSGLENLPKDRGVVFIFSHASFLDIPIVFAATDGFFNFAAKAYVFKIPIIGQVGKVMGTIKIYKDDLEKSIREYKRAEAMLKEGESFMIAPEGTRSDSEVINPFKSGPFLFAMGAQADLVPVVIYGASKIWSNKEAVPNMSSFGGLVRVHVMPKVSIGEFNQENRKDKAEQIRQQMIVELNKLKAKDIK